MIHKGTIRAYTPATHTASVQLTGSIAHHLTGIRVATNIPAAAVVAGRECTFLALDPNNPTDGLVLSIQGALPPAGGGTTDHAALTHLAYADAGHTGFATSGHGHAHSALTALDYASAAHTDFCSLATAQTITAQKLIDSAVGLRFGHAAGPLLQAAASGDDLTLTGDLAVSGHLGLANIDAKYPIYLAKTISNTSWTAALLAQITQSGSGAAYGVYGFAKHTGVATSQNILGLYFDAIHQNAYQLSNLEVMRTTARISSAGGVDTLYGIHLIFTYTGAGRPTTAIGIDVEDPSYPSATTTYGLRIYDVGYASSSYILELGPSPYLRLLGSGSWTPAANRTPLYLAEGATPTLRQVQWKAGNALVAGDKVMVLV